MNTSDLHVKAPISNQPINFRIDRRKGDTVIYLQSKVERVDCVSGIMLTQLWAQRRESASRELEAAETVFKSDDPK